MTTPGAERYAKTVDSDKIQALLRSKRLPDHYLDDLKQTVAPLVAELSRLADRSARPVLVGLNGCQGSGKSTLAQFIQTMLQIGADLPVAVLSQDDFYLTRSERQQLGQRVHPLLATRGVPGTHDLPLTSQTLDRLLDANRTAPAQVPVFNKATDDREPREAWPWVAPNTPVILLEGWCVGCSAQPAEALEEAMNALEANEDRAGRWRGYVNEQLATDYRRLFARLDRLIMLKAPSFDCVAEWRTAQEQQLIASLAPDDAATSKVMSAASLERFIQHFERLTRHQLNTMPAEADAIVTLNREHRMTDYTGRLV